MSYSIRFEDSDAGVILTYQGRIGAKDMNYAHDVLFADERFASLRFMIVDRTDCEFDGVSADDARAIAARWRDKLDGNQQMKLLLATGDPVQSDLGVVFRSELGPYRDQCVLSSDLTAAVSDSGVGAGSSTADYLFARMSRTRN